MKTRTLKKTSAPPKTIKEANVKAVHLSDDAFYLITLISLLKSIVKPESFHQFLETGKSGGLTKLSIE